MKKYNPWQSEQMQVIKFISIIIINLAIELPFMWKGNRYNVLSSNVANVDFNKDVTTKDSIRYTWFAEKERTYLFSDVFDIRGGQEGTNIHGSFGAIIIEKEESTWFNSVTEKELGI